MKKKRLKRPPAKNIWSADRAGIPFIRDQRVRRVLRVDPTVHRDISLPPARLPQPRCLAEHVRHHFLSAEAGIHGHDEHLLNPVEERPERFFPGLRTQGDAGLRARCVDRVDQRVRVACRLEVEHHRIRPRLRKDAHKRFGIIHHQVHVDGRVRKAFPDGREQRGPKRQVRHKMSVHDVQMDPSASGPDHARKLLLQPHRIRGQYGRRNFNHTDSSNSHGSCPG